MRITNKNIETLKPNLAPYEVRDESVKGFLARIQPTGRITYYFDYRNGDGKRQRIRLLPIKSRKQRYIKHQRAQLEWWKNRIGVFTLTNVSQSLLAECRDELGKTRCGSTVNRYLAALSHVFTIAVKEWEWLDASPITKLRKPKENKGRVRFLSEQERDAIIAACLRERRKPLYLLTVLAISTGGRKMELLGMKWQNVDLERAVITLEDTKNSDTRSIFLSGLALIELRLYSQHRHPRSKFVFPARCGTKPMDIDREFKRTVTRAGIHDFHFHDLRHTCASELAMNGASLAEIAEVLGHRRLEMVKRYAHLSKTHTASVVADMNAKIFKIPSDEPHLNPG